MAQTDSSRAEPNDLGLLGDNFETWDIRLDHGVPDPETFENSRRTTYAKSGILPIVCEVPAPPAMPEGIIDSRETREM